MFACIHMNVSFDTTVAFDQEGYNGSYAAKNQGIQWSGRQYSRKYPVVMMAYIFTETGILASVFSIGLSISVTLHALVSLPPSFSLSPSQTPL